MDEDLAARVEQLTVENRRLLAQLEARDRLVNRALVTHQRGVSHEEEVRRLQRDLSRLTLELDAARNAATPTPGDRRALEAIARAAVLPLDAIAEHCALVLGDERSSLAREARWRLAEVRGNVEVLLALVAELLDQAAPRDPDGVSSGGGPQEPERNPERSGGPEPSSRNRVDTIPATPLKLGESAVAEGHAASCVVAGAAR